MSDQFIVIESEGKITRGKRVYVGETQGKDERWLRDRIFENPEIIPVDEIDPTFGPLIPVCKELKTSAGYIDALFINCLGRLTVLECKLWKNPQARREVVAQTLDYVAQLSAWTYADLQRTVSATLGRQGNYLYELVQNHSNEAVREQIFVDHVSRALREGRFLGRKLINGQVRIPESPLA